MKRRAPPECLHRPQSKDSSAVFPFDPWGSVSLSIDLEREGKERKKEQGERERERERSAVRVTLLTAHQNLHLVKMMILSEARLGLSLPGCPWQDSSQLSMLMRVMTCSSL